MNFSSLLKNQQKLSARIKIILYLNMENKLLHVFKDGFRIALYFRVIRNKLFAVLYNLPLSTLAIFKNMTAGSDSIDVHTFYFFSECYENYS